MKLITTFLAGALCVGTFAQEVKRCYTHEAMLHQEELTPGYLQSVDEVFYRAKEIGTQDRATVYTIPVVVHIVYKTPEENLADSIIFNQIEELNRAFRRLNADTVNMRLDFAPIVGDSYIQFELATTDPDGNPTNGITRTLTTHDSFLGVGGSPAEGVKSTAEEGIDPWNQADYLNIWVCNMTFLGSPFILGYATPPNNLSHWPPGSSDNLSDGVVIEYEVFGANNPNTIDMGSGPMDILGRTCVHEVGHYLGLRHIWGDGDCTAEDGIDDTPNADDQSNFDCDTTKNTCLDAIGTLGDLPDMVENYMDYSAETCQNSFTIGQADMMRSILENERYELINGTPALSVQENKVYDFGMYPNPSNGEVKLSAIPQEVELISVFSETGQVVYRKAVNSSDVMISGLSKGLYIVQLSGVNGTTNEKLIVL
ncbi:MAG: M43 family zinc metalloprotease [Crocinitomicaceae bacterium]